MALPPRVISTPNPRSLAARWRIASRMIIRCRIRGSNLIHLHNDAENTIRLGDTKDNDQWGQHSRWGVVAVFNHGNNGKECHHKPEGERRWGSSAMECLDCPGALSRSLWRGGGVLPKAASNATDATVIAGLQGAGQLDKQARLDPRLTPPRDWITNNIAVLTRWIRSSRAPRWSRKSDKIRGGSGGVGAFCLRSPYDHSSTLDPPAASTPKKVKRDSPCVTCR